MIVPVSVTTKCALSSNNNVVIILRGGGAEDYHPLCMYLLIGKGQSAQKRPYWGEDRIKREKFMSKHMSLIVV